MQAVKGEEAGRVVGKGAKGGGDCLVAADHPLVLLPHTLCQYVCKCPHVIISISSNTSVFL